MHEWERKREFSLGTRILLQVLRFALAALFFYIAYLGIIWRTTPAPPLPHIVVNTSWSRRRQVRCSPLASPSIGGSQSFAS